mgnify:CR=1 FL=1
MDYDTPKSRKGKHGSKKDQKKKGQQEHRLGSSKGVRIKEGIMEKKSHKMVFHSHKNHL